MFPDSAVRPRQEAAERAAGVRNTREIGAALFRAGLPQYRFTAPERPVMPVLIVSGGQDGTAVTAGLCRLSTRLPDSRVLEFERSGHFVYLDEPQRFADTVRAFLRDPAGTRSNACRT